MRLSPTPSPRTPPRRIAAFAAALLLCGTAAAQQPDTLERVLVLDSVVVTGTRGRAVPELPAASVSVVGRAAVEAEGGDNVLPAVATHVPGVFLQKRGTAGFGVSPGAGGSISIRGVSGQPNTRVLVLIDDQPQFMGIFGHPLPDTYVAGDVARVEVVRGPASTRYGAQALAGAVNIVTRDRLRPGLHATLRTGYGSASTLLQHAAAGFQGRRLTLFGALDHQRTDGIRDDRDDAFRMLGGSARATYALSPSLRLGLDGSLADARFHDPGPVTGEKAPADSVRDYVRGRVALSVRNRFDRLDGALIAYHSFGEHDFTGGFSSTDATSGLLFFQHLHPTPGTRLTVGVENTWYGGEASVATPAGRIVLLGEDRLHAFDVYALAQTRLFERLVVSGGVRRAHHAAFGAEWVPTAGVVFDVSPGTTLRATVAKGFRRPLPVDLFIGPVANPDLQPERLWNYEVGAGQHLLGGDLRLDVALFRMEGTNLIQVVGGPAAPRRQNVGALSNRGVEVAADYAPAGGWHLFARYAYLHLDTPTLLAPEHDLAVGAAYGFARYRIRLDGHYVHDLYVVLPPADARQERYFLLGARLEARLFPRTRLHLRGENLLDRAYEIDAGYPMPGTTWFVGAEVAF